MELVLSRAVFRIFSRMGWSFHGRKAKKFHGWIFFFSRGKKKRCSKALPCSVGDAVISVLSFGCCQLVAVKSVPTSSVQRQVGANLFGAVNFGANLFGAVNFGANNIAAAFLGADIFLC